MSVRIGVPRGLLYYYYGELWGNFFNKLGAEMITSRPTSKETLNCGSTLDGVCLPVKAYFGHVIEIHQKVDYIFMPRIVSVAKGQYTCPELIGLTDMVRSNLTNLPPLIDENISLLKNKRQLYQSIIGVGEILGKGALKSLYAWNTAYKEFCHKENCVSKRYQVTAERGKRIGIIGHPYILYDSLISMNVLEKLQKLGVHVLTADKVELPCANKASSFLEKKLFWSYCQHLVGAAQVMLTQEKTIDGMIVITSFACGPDSLMVEIIKQQAQTAEIPCMLLTVDEHTGENAFVTRLEAFVDMLTWRS
ncbi:acyl-CoA dehydratase activase-related protein [Pelosinus sp. IPA-1]|uniref:acyl-CoA dehydratase activase-related protein n=1 Tax=Pelosinus sp. IPA-1 TaxID=3029569 RepID=UPI00243614AF|nr:acyl-CoA dehydratase activase-related protein [Pelosinus sp. IPA-1]GMB00269.1 hypothetical protein PIPA1_30680 [Pelosinus sp. IPA-1]